MTNEFAERRREIIAFLNGLTQREKLVVLACLSNDAAISAHIPDLAKTIFDMQRAHYRAELVALAERSSLELRLLARRKGCRVEPTEVPADHCYIVYADDSQARVDLDGDRTTRTSLTHKQALEILRSLPDHRRKA